MHRPPPGKNWCSGCQEFLPNSEFHKSKNRMRGLTNICKSCRAGRSAVVYSNHRRMAARLGCEPLPIERYRKICSSPCVIGGGRRPQFRVGVDRINSDLGYTFDNTQPMCPLHNSLKGRMDYDHFLVYIERRPWLRECGNDRGGRVVQLKLDLLKRAKKSRPEMPQLFEER